MKPIVARNQVRLGLGRAVRLAVSGMSYRLLRSGITTAILALAVAFLVHVLTHAILAERTQRSAWDALEPTRTANQFFTRLTTPDSPTGIKFTLGGDAAHLPEYHRWHDQANTPQGQTFAELRETAQRWRELHDWFAARSDTESAILLGGLSISERIDQLKQPGAIDTVLGRIDTLNLGWPFTTDYAAYTEWVMEDFPELNDAVAVLRDQHAQAIQRFAAADPRPALQRFADPTSSVGDQLQAAGLEFSSDQVEAARGFAHQQESLAEVRDALQKPAVQQAAVRAVGSAEFDAVIRGLAERAPGWWYVAIGQGGVSSGIGPVARRHLDEQRLQAVTDGYQPLERDTPFGLPLGTLWLVGLSLLVCVVGVTNALLMSVTERFSEIATMKCLGAMDRSVMQMFVAEAVIQGVLGGTVGVLLGLLLTVVRGFAEFGALFMRGFEGWASVLSASALSLGIGVLLAAFAAIGPSWVASRLAPMEAMRVE